MHRRNGTESVMRNAQQAHVLEEAAAAAGIVNL
jgi:hypothetical protein